MKNLVLIHKYLETGFVSIVCFGDSLDVLNDIKYSHPRFGSSRHLFVIYKNDSTKRVHGVSLNRIKDSNLLSICENVALYLSFGEYAMLKKSYFKSSAWFEKAKNSAFLASDILDNY